MSLPTIYHFHRGTKVFQGTSLADPDQLDPNSFLMPAFATLVAPPETIPEGQVALFDEGAQTWSLAAAEIEEPPPGEEPLPLDDLKAAAQAQIDAYFEVLYATSVPTPAITKEYDSAYQQAKAWLLSLAEGRIVMICPWRVEALAETLSTPEKPVTNQQAAEYVVKKFTEAEMVLDRRGAARLRAKAAIRKAADAAGVADALAAGKAAMGDISYTL